MEKGKTEWGDEADDSVDFMLASSTTGLKTTSQWILKVALLFGSSVMSCKVQSSLLKSGSSYWMTKCSTICSFSQRTAESSSIDDGVGIDSFLMLSGERITRSNIVSWEIKLRRNAILAK